MITLELFCGTKSFSKVAKELGHETFTIDFDRSFDPDMVKDILTLNVSDLPERFQHPDVVWASPPCQGFSVAALGRNWDMNKQPKTDTVRLGLALVRKTLEIIKELDPKYWYIENPRAMLRIHPIMDGIHRKTVTYCQYGDTDIL